MLQEFTDTVVQFAKDSTAYTNEPFDTQFVFAEEWMIKDYWRLKQIKQEEKILEKEKIDIQNKIKAVIGDKEALVNDQGIEIITYRFDSAVTTFNKTKFELEHPVVYAQYCYKAKPVRKFVPK